MDKKYENKFFYEWIDNFIIESNRIEGIDRPPTKEEKQITMDFLNLEKVTIKDLEIFVKTCQPDAVLRDRVGLNVRVGNHFPPLGGIDVKLRLLDLIGDINEKRGIGLSPFLSHIRYETIHPFTDGNGRSGRVLWLWHMMKLQKSVARLGFLQTWYYNSLDEHRK